MHSFLYLAIEDSLECDYPLYPSTRLDEMRLPCVVARASFSEGSVPARNWTFKADVEFTLIVPTDGKMRMQIEEAEDFFIESLRRLTADTLNNAVPEGPMSFYSGFAPTEIGDWEANDQFSEPALALTVRGSITVQR